MSKNDKSSSAISERTDGAASNQGASEIAPGPSKTPMYQATHADRYQRQALIKKIQETSGNQLLCYVSGKAASIDRDDTIGFVDLLHNVDPEKNVDLMLHTPGGDIDSAEKLISMVRTAVGQRYFRVIVPDFAKSAGTLMALGADKIIMSDTSELGPIDPQIVLNDGHGNMIPHSVQCYLDAYETHSAALVAKPDNVVAQIMLNKLDPGTVKLYESARNRARTLAEQQLLRGMFRKRDDNANALSPNITEIAGMLIDTKRWQTHSQMISYEDAREMKLSVEHLSPKSQEWQAYWQLYCLQRLAVKDREKLFESGYASLVFEKS